MNEEYCKFAKTSHYETFETGENSFTSQNFLNIQYTVFLNFGHLETDCEPLNKP